MIEAWEARLAGDSADAERRFEAARELAQVRGYRYLTAGRVANLPIYDLVERIEAVAAQGRGRDQKPRDIEAAALLGGAEAPPITVSRALELFWTLAADRVHGKSADQIRRWRNTRSSTSRTK
ncbi:hypothetical protein [Alkalilacustris brevis]|uniref:hypothetical protein n=1 Tax=Alkalilacustris brevis TaxID=2026338 RepID=UPI000E0D13B4|nr:hypothetical protein [Alkalilacustris brevis]